MKSILYVGATLMIGASIYGFVDYQKTSHKKEFTTMYKEPVAPEPVKTITEQPVVTPAKTEVVVAEKKTIAAIAEKKATKKKNRKFSTKLFSRGALDERYIKEEIKVEPVKEKTESVKSENKGQ